MVFLIVNKNLQLTHLTICTHLKWIVYLLGNSYETKEYRMNDLILKEDLVYYITKEDIQSEARRRIGRGLENKEFEIIRELVDNGISMNIDTIYNVIFTEEVNK